MKEVATVYRTEDLSIFKTLKGNREVKENRKQTLIESIDKHGYITNPIIVNECMVPNMNMKNWSSIDFIESYAKQGNEDYKRILDLSRMGFGIRTYMFANGLWWHYNCGKCD